jgi:hypothetical protein
MFAAVLLIALVFAVYGLWQQGTKIRRYEEQEEETFKDRDV